MHMLFPKYIHACIRRCLLRSMWLSSKTCRQVVKIASMQCPPAIPRASSIGRLCQTLLRADTFCAPRFPWRQVEFWKAYKAQLARVYCKVLAKRTSAETTSTACFSMSNWVKQGILLESSLGGDPRAKGTLIGGAAA